MKNILVVGSVNADLTIYTDRLPHPGETVEGSGFSAAFGGKGANQAIAAAKLGGNVRFYGHVGDDAYGAPAIDNLRRCGVDFTGRTVPGFSTGAAVITVCGGENSIILSAGANATVTPEALEEHAALFRWADYVLLQLEIPTDAVLRAMELARAAGAQVILNPAPVRPLPAQAWQYADYLIPNEHEAAAITGISTDTPAGCAAAAARLQEMGAGRVIITRGSQGCVCLENGAPVFRPARPVRAVDTTAAGDCFIGALCAALCRGRTFGAAVDCAAAAAAITVSRPGSASSIPTAAELHPLFD